MLEEVANSGEIDEDCLAARQEIWDSDSEEKPRENQEERRRAKN